MEVCREEGRKKPPSPPEAKEHATPRKDPGTWRAGYYSLMCSLLRLQMTMASGTAIRSTTKMATGTMKPAETEQVTSVLLVPLSAFSIHVLHLGERSVGHDQKPRLWGQVIRLGNGRMA